MTIQRLCMGIIGTMVACVISAAAASYEVDKGKSSITIAAKATGHEFSGNLKAYQLTAEGDPATMLPTALELSWEFKDLDTDDQGRDDEMLKWMGGNTKGSYKFAKIWSKNGVNYAAGTLTIHGVSKAVHIPITVNKTGDVITTTGKVVINYKDFGLPLVRAMLVMTVDPEVTVSFTLVGKAK